MNEPAITHLARIAGICVAGGDDIKEPQKDMIRAAVIALRDAFTAASKRIAELEGERDALTRERNAYREAKQENDERFMIEADAAAIRAIDYRNERDDARAKLAAREAYLREIEREAGCEGSLDTAGDCRVIAHQVKSMRKNLGAALERQHAESAQGEWRGVVKRLVDAYDNLDEVARDAALRTARQLLARPGEGVKSDG